MLRRLPRSQYLNLQSTATKVAALSLLSQAVAAVAIASTSSLGLRTSDTYAVGVQVGNGALAGVAISIVYMLAIGRPTFKHWGLWKLVACIYSIGLAVITLAFSHVAGGGSGTTAGWLIGLYGLGGALLGAAGVGAVREACLGRPLRLAALTIVPNIAMLAGTATASWSNADFELLPAVAWATGCAMLHIRRPSEHRQVDDTTDSRPDRIGLHSTGLVIGASVGTILPPLYLTTLSSLEPGTATALALATRVGSGLVGITANSVLLARYSWANVNEFEPRISKATTTTSLVFFVVALAFVPTGVEPLIVGSAFMWWFMSLVAAPFINREVNAQRLAGAVLAKGAIDLGLSLLTLWALVARPSVLGFLGVVVVSQGVTGVVGSLALRQRRLAVLSSLLLVTGFVPLLVPLA